MPSADRAGGGRDCVYGSRRQPLRALLPPFSRHVLVDVGVTDECTRCGLAGRPATFGRGGMGVRPMRGAGTTLTHDRYRRPRRSPIRCRCHGRGRVAAHLYGWCRFVLVAAVRVGERKHASTSRVSADAGEKVFFVCTILSSAPVLVPRHVRTHSRTGQRPHSIDITPTLAPQTVGLVDRPSPSSRALHL